MERLGRLPDHRAAFGRVSVATRPTVLHVTQPGEAGVARAALEAATAAAEQGFSAHVACPPATPLATALQAASGDVEIHNWAAKRDAMASVPAEVRALSTIVDRVRPDVVHLHSSRAGMVGRLALRARRPTIFQPHAWSFRALDNPALSAAARAWEIAALRWTDRLVCVSRAERDALGLPSGKRTCVSVLPNAVDLRLFRPAEIPGERTRVRAELGLAAEVPVFVCVGRLSRQKGQDVLLRAWRRVVATAPEAQLLLVGSGPMRRSLEQQNAQGVRLLGEREDVPDLLRAADVYVSAARWEGMSYALVEAAASGLSLVSTDVDGASEVIRSPESGEAAGVIVPRGSAESLAREMCRRATDRDLRLMEGRRARRRACAHHDLVTWRESMTQVVMDLAATATR